MAISTASLVFRCADSLMSDRAHSNPLQIVRLATYTKPANNMKPEKTETGFAVTPEQRNGLAVSGVVEAILEVGRQRKTILQRLRTALECGDTDNALKFARQLCGLENEEGKGNRIGTRIN